MPQQTMTELGKYRETFEREYQTTMKLVREYPADKLDLKPSAKSGTARDTLWTLALGQMVIGAVTERNELSPEGLPAAPESLPGIIAGLEAAHRDTAAKLRTMTAERMNTTLRMPVGPKQMGDVRRGDALWMFLYDGIHHRGQLSVYQRIAGGRVPSLYGPSLDEPWS
jgi:uncharacterized damage-inducible protein DinB